MSCIYCNYIYENAQYYSHCCNCNRIYDIEDEFHCCNCEHEYINFEYLDNDIFSSRIHCCKCKLIFPILNNHICKK